MSGTVQSARKTVRVAVVGLGFMGVTHLRSWKQIPEAEIIAVCDAVRFPVNGVLPGVSGNLAGNDALDLGNKIRVYQSLEETLNDKDIDIVDLCVPTPLHPPQAIAALRAGKHVICEKPLARNLALAREIQAVASNCGTFFMPAMCLRFWPEWVWARQAVAQQTFGAVLAARFRRVSEPPGWSRGTYFNGEQSGGALLDLHIHDTDFVQFLFGRPKAVFSVGLTRFSGAIDHVVTQYLFDNKVVHAEGTWIMTGGHGFNMAFTLNCEQATIDYDLSRGAEALKVFRDGQPVEIVKPAGADGYVGELAHMAHAVLAGQPPTVVTLADGVSAVEICEAEEASIRSGRIIPLP